MASVDLRLESIKYFVPKRMGLDHIPKALGIVCIVTLTMYRPNLSYGQLTLIILEENARTKEGCHLASKAGLVTIDTQG